MFKLTKERQKKLRKNFIDVDNELLIGEYSKNVISNGGVLIKDEYYTMMSTVEEIFNIIDKRQFKDKIIYSPCDDENSNFVKYIKSHKDELQYKEYIYTSDDYNNHIDIFEKCDYVITNPPFSKIQGELQPLILRTKCKYFLIGNSFNIDGYFMNDNNVKFFYLAQCYRWFMFPKKDDNKKYVGYMLILGNGDISKSFEDNLKNRIINSFKCNLSDIKIYVNINGIEYPAIDYLRRFPKDYDGWVCAPITALSYYNIFNFKIIDNKDKKTYSDNKNRFKRILIKRIEE